MHRLFPAKTRQLAMSLLLFFRRGALQLPCQTLLTVLLPLAMEAAWVTPQELWELEDGEVDQETEEEIGQNDHGTCTCARRRQASAGRSIFKAALESGWGHQ